MNNLLELGLKIINILPDELKGLAQDRTERYAHAFDAAKRREDERAHQLDAFARIIDA